jgi:hypothetical protein
MVFTDRVPFLRKAANTSILISLMFVISGCAKQTTDTQGIQTPANQWLMPDVSVLFPAPKALPNANAIFPTTSGSLGALIPTSLIQSLPLLEPNITTTIQQTRLELVGVRFDPPQVRLVWQIFKSDVGADGRTEIVAYDTAVHAFYNLNDSAAFTAELKNLNTLARPDLSIQNPLGVHPTLATKGWNSAYGSGLKALILKWCGEQNLYKMTFMAATGEHLRWEFGGFNYLNGNVTPLTIPKINLAGIQKFINSSPSAGEFKGGIDMVPAGQNEFDNFISDSGNSSFTAPDKLGLAHFTAITLENPQLAITDQTDCASCHVAQMTKNWTEGHNPALISDTRNLFTSSTYNLASNNENKMRSDNLRSFGWFAGTPSISQRSINETAIVADRLTHATP